MPTARLQEFIDRLDALEKKMDAHLRESVSIVLSIATTQNDIFWIKWLLSGIGVVGLAILGVLLRR
jgi:hypothetical protein